jgi:hypothetical protein
MQVRNKLQFTGKTRFTQKHPEYPDDPNSTPTIRRRERDRQELDDAPQLLGGHRHLQQPPEQNVALTRRDHRGRHGRARQRLDRRRAAPHLRSQAGELPLIDALGNPVGNPAGFNTSLGYFGPDDGDDESIDPADLPIVGGVRIAGWDTNGDGLADVNGDRPQPPGSTAVPFHGYGKINIRFDPNMVLPDGVKLPLKYIPLSSTYKEGRL